MLPMSAGYIEQRYNGVALMLVDALFNGVGTGEVDERGAVV
jgi:hypothetical protein